MRAKTGTDLFSRRVLAMLLLQALAMSMPMRIREMRTKQSSASD